MLLIISVINTNTVSSRKKEHHNKILLSQLDESSTDFIIGINSKADVTQNGTVGTQTEDRGIRFERSRVGDNSVCHKKIIEKTLSED